LVLVIDAIMLCDYVGCLLYVICVILFFKLVPANVMEGMANGQGFKFKPILKPCAERKYHLGITYREAIWIH